MEDFKSNKSKNKTKDKLQQFCVFENRVRSAENVTLSSGQVSQHIAPCGDRSLCLKTIQLQHLLVWGLKASNKEEKHAEENPAGSASSLKKQLQPPHYTFTNETISNFLCVPLLDFVMLILPYKIQAAYIPFWIIYTLKFSALSLYPLQWIYSSPTSEHRPVIYFLFFIGLEIASLKWIV